ncbi:MAG: response regulator transcription factor [Bacilli bacterium]|jgi:two-component system alkaline phosphatase synthesis response regulator PhoP
MKHLIYSVEDDKDIAYIINTTLTKQGYEVKTFYNGKSFFEAFKKEKPEMILLDMMLPDISGSEILKEIRSDEKNNDIDIIIISANTLLVNKIDGLDLGADDYIEKPFNILELMSRINAKFRRRKKTNLLQQGDIVLDVNKHTCFKGKEEIFLTVREFEILTLLMNKAGEAVSREEIINQIWGVDSILETRAVDMHIKSIREKLGDKDMKIIKTVHGIGYRISL